MVDKHEPPTAVWQNGGFSAKLKICASKSAKSPSRKSLNQFSTTKKIPFKIERDLIFKNF